MHPVRCVQLMLYETADGTSLVPLRMTFSMIGKFGITGSFGIVFLYTPEIFPTTLRYVLQSAHLYTPEIFPTTLRYVLQLAHLYTPEIFPTTLRYVLQLAYLGSGVRHWVTCRLQVPRLFFVDFHASLNYSLRTVTHNLHAVPRITQNQRLYICLFK